MQPSPRTTFANGAAVQVRLLGAVELWCGGRRLDLGPRQRRHVLAVLAAEPGCPVPVDLVVDRVWGTTAPPRARRSVQAHIARLRRLFEEARTGIAVVRDPAGYVLAVEPHAVDLRRFQELTESGRAAEALRLWRGAPLADLTGDWADTVRERWERHRLDAVLAWAGSELAAGSGERVAGMLTELVAEHPLHEGLSVALMRALAASGQTARALGVFVTAREQLVRELGVEPGPELRAAHRRLLQVEEIERDRTVPAQLPPAVRGFTGRADALAHLDDLLAGPRDTVLSVVISGTAGVGKTALAVTWAHRVRDRFPDGQLYVDLRGYDPQRPLPTAVALAAFLSALGVPARDIPIGVEERSARFRTELARRRILVVLDNASSAQQVRPLLAGSPSSAVLITSRDALAGLVAVEGAQRLVLDLLSERDATALLSRLVGAAADRDPAAARALAVLCARLPLALRIAAELASARPGTTVAGLVNELRDRRQRLSRLDAGGDPRAGVSAVFSWSLQQLPEAVIRTFRLLALYPGDDIDPCGVAALAGLDRHTARQHLDILSRAHLVSPTGTQRYGMHDLLRAYAQASGDEDGEPALDRLFTCYLENASAALEELYSERADPPAAAVQAREWLDTERATLLTLIGFAVSSGRPQYAIRLARKLFRYLNTSYPIEALAVNQRAHEAALLLGDSAAEANALLGMGVAAAQMAGQAEAAGYLREAAGIYRRLGDRAGEAQTWNGLAILRHLTGDHQLALRYCRRSLALSRQAEDPAGQSRALNNLGFVERTLGRYDKAMEYLRQSRTINEKTGNRYSAAVTACNIGLVLFELGRPREAIDEWELALARHRETGNRSGEAEILTCLGSAWATLGFLERADDLHRRSLELAEATGSITAAAQARNGCGELDLAVGRPGLAARHHQNVLDKGPAVAVIERARAHAGLGRAHRELGSPASAADHFRRSIALYRELGSPFAAALEDELASTPSLDRLAG